MPKRKSEDAAEPPVLDDTTMPIRVKTEGQSMDYSEDVKKKLSTASRTSTACDRCRVRPPLPPPPSSLLIWHPVY